MICVWRLFANTYASPIPTVEFEFRANEGILDVMLRSPQISSPLRKTTSLEVFYQYA
jgi:hypothetical protein